MNSGSSRSIRNLGIVNFFSMIGFGGGEGSKRTICSFEFDEIDRCSNNKTKKKTPHLDFIVLGPVFFVA